MTSLIVGLSFALSVVWMQRHNRWYYFAEGLTGRLIIAGSRAGSSGTTPNPTPGSVVQTPGGPVQTKPGLPIVPQPKIETGSGNPPGLVLA